MLARALILLFAILAAGCQQPAKTTPLVEARAPSSTAWRAFVDEYLEAYFASAPTMAARAGRHDFDGRLPDLSREGLRRTTAMLHDFRARAQAFDAASLDSRQRFERDYLVAEIDDRLFWFEAIEVPFANPGYYGFVLSPDLYLEREYAPLEQRMRAYVKYARAIPAATARVRENLRTPMPRTFVQLGHIVFGGLASHYEKTVPAIFAPVADSRLQEEFASANVAALRAMRELDAWIQAQAASATDDFAIGPARFREM